MTVIEHAIVVATDGPAMQIPSAVLMTPADLPSHLNGEVASWHKLPERAFPTAAPETGSTRPP